MSLEEAYQAIDLGTITLLLGMMIVVANLRISGFFALVNAWVARRVHQPLLLLAAIVVVSGVFSAFLVNDAICLVMAPLVLELTLGLDAIRCRICWLWRWHRMSARRRRSPAIRRT